MIKRYAAVNDDGVVYNVVLWDGVSECDHGAAQLIQTDNAGIGWTLVAGELKQPPPPPDLIKGGG